MPMGIIKDPNDSGTPYKVVISTSMHLSVFGIKPRSSVFLFKCVTS